jgi:hypothetical protein
MLEIDGPTPAAHARRGIVCLRVCIAGANRVLRGGSWINNGRNVRSANRNRNEPGNRNNNIGFRLALALALVETARDQMRFRSALQWRQKAHALRYASRHRAERLPKRRLAVKH